MKELLLASYGYNRWATGRILKLAAEISSEELDAGGEHSHSSLRALLFHTYSTEWIWRNLSQSGRLGGPRPKTSQFESIQALGDAWEDEARQMQAYLESLSQDDLDEFMQLRDPRGGGQTFTRWQMLTHLLMHSMGHRSEAAAILTAFGRSPGDLDMIFYIIEQNRSA